ASFAKKYIYNDINSLPEKYAVITPGARVYKNTVSAVVRDRLEAGADCIKKGKGEKILLSGDHGRKDYDEVNRMKDYLQKIYGIEGEKIFMDHAGFSTYETMYRARDIFCVKDAIVVTQQFHTVRSVYIGRKLGLDIVAYSAPEITGFANKLHMSWAIRESLARVKSFFLVLFNVKPTYLGEKIPITEDSKKSWD
ncbi:MAG: YdcF family protein, partial [Treponema sp.]|nr:YdcF family protein [Treponema sp.]